VHTLPSSPLGAGGSRAGPPPASRAGRRVSLCANGSCRHPHTRRRALEDPGSGRRPCCFSTNRGPPTSHSLVHTTSTLVLRRPRSKTALSPGAMRRAPWPTAPLLGGRRIVPLRPSATGWRGSRSAQRASPRPAEDRSRALRNLRPSLYQRLPTRQLRHGSTRLKSWARLSAPGGGDRHEGAGRRPLMALRGTTRARAAGTTRRLHPAWTRLMRARRRTPRPTPPRRATDPAALPLPRRSQHAAVRRPTLPELVCAHG
jgi:hypothetical protein